MGALDLVPACWRPAARYWKRRTLRQVEPELDWFYRNLSSGRVLDIGANTGDYTCAAIANGHRVDAFEPMPQCAAILRQYERPGVQVHQCAISDTPGELALTVPYWRGRWEPALATLDGAHWQHLECQTLPVVVRTIDSYGFVGVTGIKIDVEGYELAVLRGAAETIRRERPVLLIELVAEWLDRPIADAFAEIAAFGYDGSYLGNAMEERPVATFEVAKHQTWDGHPPTERPINTFLFRPH